MADSVQCHPGLLRSYRERRGWTQMELAVRAGFGERVIRKAEAGEPVRPDTLDALAAALSTDAERLVGSDLTNDPLAIAQSYVRTYLAHGVDSARHSAHLVDPAVVMAIHPGANGLGFSGEFVGVEGIDRMLRAAAAHFESVSEDFGKWFTNGPQVAAMRHQVVRAKGVPDSPEIKTFLIHEYTVQGGRIKRIDTYLDAAVYLRLIHFATAESRDAAEQLPPPLKPTAR